MLAICQASGMVVAITPSCVTVSPFISQAVTAPVCVLLHTRSARPSPSRSPMSAIRQASGMGDPIPPPPVTVSPFMNQAATSPVSTFLHTKSARPSPSRSEGQQAGPIWYTAMTSTSLTTLIVSLGSVPKRVPAPLTHSLKRELPTMGSAMSVTTSPDQDRREKSPIPSWRPATSVLSTMTYWLFALDCTFNRAGRPDPRKKSTVHRDLHALDRRVQVG